jgi:hypothetical protein
MNQTNEVGEQVSDEMLPDYSHLQTSIRRHDKRYTRERVMNAPVYVIGTDGIRRRKASLHQLEAQMNDYPTKEFEVIIEALKIIARERGEESVQFVLAQCEHELMKLRQVQTAYIA